MEGTYQAKLLIFLKKYGLLFVLAILLALFFHFQLYSYLSFSALKAHRQTLLTWTQENLVWAVLGFMAIYTLSVAASIPGATLLTLTGGFLFGPFLGTGLVVTSATLGAFIVFLAVELALRDWMAHRTAAWLKVMEKGFQRDALSYLLFLRLVPLFPFWLVNIVPALLGVSKRVFVLGTFVGIIPGSFVYVTVGNGLGYIFDSDKTPDLSIIFEWRVLLPILGLAVLSMVPVLYRKFKRKK